MITRRTVLPLAAALLAACTGRPAPAQESEERCHPCWATVHVGHAGDRTELRAQGEVEVTDDYRVSAIAPGGWVRMEEDAPGRPHRTARLTPGPDGGVRVDYREEGRAAEPDDADRAWMDEMVRNAVRQGLAARGRAERLRARGGVPAVLRAVEELEGDGARKTYYTVLLANPAVRLADAARVLRHAGEHLESDGDLSRLLRWTVEERDGALADAGAREAFFAAAGSVDSDGDRARVLNVALAEDGERPEVALAVLESARGIGSDGDKTRVLRSVPAAALRDGRVAAAYRSVTQTIRSEGDRRRASNHFPGNGR